MTERSRIGYPPTPDELTAAMERGRRERALAFRRWFARRDRNRDEAGDRACDAAQPAH
jgi:hypothetical protein